MTFWYTTDVSTNILQVTTVDPDSSAPGEGEGLVAPTPIVWKSKGPSDYSAIWDECKRCPLARDGSYRYQLVDAVITPTATVADIDIPAGMAINADGTLYRL